MARRIDGHSTRRVIGILENWKADHRRRIAVSQFVSFPVRSGDLAAARDKGLRFRESSPGADSASPHLAHRGVPCSTRRAPASAPYSPPGVPPAARGKCIRQAYSTAPSK